MTWKPGNEVWLLAFDAEHRRWRPELHGYVERVSGQAMVVSTPKGRETMGLSTWPMFSSQAAAERWARENPPTAPGAPEAMGQQGMGRRNRLDE